MTRYSYTWRRRRPADLAAAGYECARCASPDRPMGTYSNLERAHLNGDTADDSPVLVLCRRCHRAHDLVDWLAAYRAWLQRERERRADENDAQRPILALLRCDQEIAGMAGQEDKPAWLVALGQNDWEVEKRLIQGEKA